MPSGDKAKYWLAGNPDAQVSDAEVTELGTISEVDFGVVSDLEATADEINSACDETISKDSSFGLNTPVVLVAGGAGNDTTIHTLQSGKIHHFGTGTGALGNADDDDAFTFKLPTPLAAGEQIVVMPVNASAYAKLLGFVCNAPATENITYYAVAQNVFIETASTATGTAGSENVFVKLNNSHFVLGITFKFTSMSTTNWRLDIDDPGNIIASGDIAVAAGNVGGYVT